MPCGVRLATASSRPDMYAGRLQVPGMALWIHTASKEGTRTCMPPRPPSPGAAGALRAAAVPLGELHAMGAGISMRVVWPRRTPCCNLAYKLPRAAQRGGGTHLSAPPTGRPRTMCTTWSFWMPAAPRPVTLQTVRCVAATVSHGAKFNIEPSSLQMFPGA